MDTELTKTVTVMMLQTADVMLVSLHCCVVNLLVAANESYSTWCRSVTLQHYYSYLLIL